MSRSSTRSGTRAQVEPSVALVAVFAVCAGLTLYAVVLDGAIVGSDRDLSRPTLDRAHDALDESGVVDSDSLAAAHAAGPDGYRLNVTLTTPDGRWTAGPVPPRRADAATRRVSVALGPTRAVPGTLCVGVWQ